MAQPALSLAVVGARHANKRGPTRLFEIALCLPGEPVDLIPEPKNPSDPQAVAVFSARGVQLGYLTAERAPWIGGMLANGRELRAIFQEATRFGAVVRVAFDGDEPTLPPARTPEEQVTEHDFYPDPIYPDE